MATRSPPVRAPIRLERLYRDALTAQLSRVIEEIEPPQQDWDERRLAQVLAKAQRLMRALPILLSIEFVRRLWSQAAASTLMRLSAHLLQQGIAPPALPDVDYPAVVAAIIADNVTLIKSLPLDYLSDVREAILVGFHEGQTAPQIGQRLRALGAISQRRATFIASDQMNKLVARLNKVTQQTAGVQNFSWVTASDERVRPAHQFLHSQIFSWDRGAPAELEPAAFPGLAINCRCWAKPVTE